jgi:hypothetical protein
VRLLNDLLKNYDSDARPVKNASEKVTVQFQLGYNQLQELVGNFESKSLID